MADFTVTAANVVGYSSQLDNFNSTGAHDTQVVTLHDVSAAVTMTVQVVPTNTQLGVVAPPFDTAKTYTVTFTANV